MIVEEIRKGRHSNEFINLVGGLFAELLKRRTRTNKKGRPKEKEKKPPRFWMEIGDEIRRLREDEGKTYTEAVDIVAKNSRFPHTASTIKNTVLPYYEKTLDALFWETFGDWEAIRKTEKKR